MLKKQPRIFETNRQLPYFYATDIARLWRQIICRAAFYLEAEISIDRAKTSDLILRQSLAIQAIVTKVGLWCLSSIARFAQRLPIFRRYGVYRLFDDSMGIFWDDQIPILRGCFEWRCFHLSTFQVLLFYIKGPKQVQATL